MGSAHHGAAATAVLGLDLVHNVGDTNNDGKFDVSETWKYTAVYEVIQDDLDNNGGGDGFIDNVATGDTAETDPLTDSARAAIQLLPAIEVEKNLPPSWRH